MTKFEIDKMENETLQLLHSDGTEEMSIGVKMIVVGIIIILLEINTVFFFLIFTLPVISRGFEWTRLEYVVPRMGFARLDYSRHQPALKRSITIILFALISIFFILGMETGLNNEFNYLNIVPITLSIAVLGMFEYQYGISNIGRYRLYGTISLILGIGVSLIGISQAIVEFWALGTSMIFIITGCIATSIGTFNFMTFLKNQEILVDIEEEEE